MINFRFHLVSLVAVFLALALGVVMGSTLIDRAIVDGLRSRINEVEKNANARGAENVQLKRRLDQLENYSQEALPHLVGRRLEGVSTVVVAVRGTDVDAVRSTTDTLRGAGSVLPGVLWLEADLAAPDQETQTRLAQTVTDPFRSGDELRRAAVEALGRRLAQGPAAPTSAAPPLVSPVDLLRALASAHFVAWESLSGSPAVDLAQYPPAGSRLVVMSGSESKLTPDLATTPLVRAAALAGAPVALAEVYKTTDKQGRGSVVRGVRTDGELSAKVATVDDADEAQGRAALAFALEELGRGQASHYGMAAGANRQIPEAQPPPSPGTAKAGRS